MLGDKTAVACLAVKDMDAAKKFYEGVLGLMAEKNDDPGGMMYKTGSSHVFVYQSEYAGSNKATAAAWGVGEDMPKIIDDLKSKGVTFEHYEGMPGTRLDGDIHVIDAAGLKAAWFKDPDGNILNLVNQM